MITICSIQFSISTVLGKARKKVKVNWDQLSSTSSGSSRLSTKNLELMIEGFMNKQTRESTAKTYFSVWRQFTKICPQPRYNPKRLGRQSNIVLRIPNQ